jgi:hypothetical protein
MLMTSAVYAPPARHRPSLVITSALAILPKRSLVNSAPITVQLFEFELESLPSPENFQYATNPEVKLPCKPARLVFVQLIRHAEIKTGRANIFFIAETMHPTPKATQAPINPQ